MSSRRRRRLLLALTGLGAVALGALQLVSTPSATPARAQQGPGGIFKLNHLIFIVQENRSFDHYFGTYPGANGIPMVDGHPSVCALDPVLKRCVRPYHSTNQRQVGGPHNWRVSDIDVNGGRMNGFVRAVVGA